MSPNKTVIAVVITLLAMIPIRLPALASSDAERLEKLERAVQMLQERNAQLEAEIKTLKKQSEPVAVAPPAEGPGKTRAISDGKKYVEKSAPI